MTVALKAHWPEWRDHAVLVIVAIFENLSKLRAAFVSLTCVICEICGLSNLLETYLRRQIQLPANELVNFHFVI
jgi:hypothetical protein